MVEPGALETCHPEQPFEASKLVRTRAQRIPSRSRALAHTKAGYICADPTARLHFSLATRRRTIHSGLPTSMWVFCQGGQRCPGRVRENAQCMMAGVVVRAGASRRVVPALRRTGHPLAASGHEGRRRRL